MYRSFSKLLHETQAAAAKKLGILENTIAEDYSCQDCWAEQVHDIQSSQPFGAEGTNAPHQSDERLTLREHQIW